MTKINRLAKIVNRYHLNKAAKYVTSGNYSEAEAIFIKILKKDPTNQKALKKYAKVAMLRNDWPAAIERWERVIAAAETAGKKYPKGAQKKIKQAMLKLSEELYKFDRLDEAKKQLEKVTALDPGNFTALTKLAEIYAKQKNWPKALEFWERVVETADTTGVELPKSNLINLKFFKRYLRAGLLSKRDTNYIEAVQDYWRINYGADIDPSLHLAFYNLTGKKDPRIIPRAQMWKEIIPYFNDKKMWVGYSDKSIYDKLINTSSSVYTVLKSVRGNYFDTNNNNLTKIKAFNILIDHKSDLIIKPSKTDNGIGIRKLTHKHNELYMGKEKVLLEELENNYGSNFIVQEVIQQHPVMAAPHPSSVNTLRIVTFRWKNEILHLLTFARFGSEGSIRDNAGKGGLCCGITDVGEFMNFAIDENTMIYSHHPTSKYCFSNQATIPNYNQFIKFAMDLHKNILHFDFVSWDIAVDKEGQPVFLEANYRGATWLYQLATQKPIFGNLTEEVLQHVSGELKKNKNIRDLEGNIE
jgi:hypothetical protein